MFVRFGPSEELTPSPVRIQFVEHLVKVGMIHAGADFLGAEIHPAGVEAIENLKYCRVVVGRRHLLDNDVLERAQIKL